MATVSCRQLGSITTDISILPKYEGAFTEKTSIFFKKTRQRRAGAKSPLTVCGAEGCNRR